MRRRNAGAKHLFSRRKGVPVNIGDNDARAAGHQRLRQGKADTRRAAGDESAFSLNFRHSFIPYTNQ